MRPAGSIATLVVAALGLACGGAEPLPIVIQDEVALLVQDDFLSKQECPQLAALMLRGELEVAGIVGVCRITVNRDGTVLSLCEQVPGKKERDLTLVYFAVDDLGPLRLVEANKTVNLSLETRSRVPLDFTLVRDHFLPDEDEDGKSNLEEVCAGSDPRAG